MKPTINLPEAVEGILNRLNENGYEAYIVGGCVRDSILGRRPQDWDIATNALPDDVKRLFEHTVGTGLKHGTVTVMIEKTGYEVTTYRVEGDYPDGRHPSHVEFTSSLTRDLSRRDFRMNAMAWHPREGLQDPFGGTGDITAQKIRTVGKPGERFSEDALRMLRAVRFSAQLSFDLHSDILEALEKYGGLIVRVSSERIRDELDRTITSQDPKKLSVLYDTGIMEYVLPELAECFATPQNNPYHIYDVGRHSLKAVEGIDNTSLLRWVMLLHDSGKPFCRTTDSKGIDHFYGHPVKSAELAQKALNRLRFDKAFIEKAVKLIYYHDLDISPEEKSVRRAVKKVGYSLFPYLLKIMEADKRAQNPEKLEGRLERIKQMESIYNSIRQEGQCISLKQLAVNGNDLISLGFPEGAAVGKALHKLLEKVIDEPDLNSKDKLLNLAAKIREEEL